MKNITLDMTKASCFLAEGAVAAFEPKVKAAQEALENGTCPGNDFLGWLHLPSSITPDFLAEIQACADTLRQNCEVVVVAGIGGSYLGARAVIEALFDKVVPLPIRPVIRGESAKCGMAVLDGIAERRQCGVRGFEMDCGPVDWLEFGIAAFGGLPRVEDALPLLECREGFFERRSFDYLG